MSRERDLGGELGIVREQLQAVGPGRERLLPVAALGVHVSEQQVLLLVLAVSLCYAEEKSSRYALKGHASELCQSDLKHVVTVAFLPEGYCQIVGPLWSSTVDMQ